MQNSQQNTLKKLSNKELEINLKAIFKKEAYFLLQAILHIKEIDRRRMHLELGFPSLFEYLTVHIGYSAGAAQRRIDAARLMNELPEIGEKIQSGELSLSHITLIQKASREVKLEKGKRVLPQEKKELLAEITSKFSFEAKRIIAARLDLPIKETKVIPQKDESVYFGLKLTKEQHEKLKQVQDLLSHSVPDGEVSKLLEYLFDKVIAQKTGNKQNTSNKETTGHKQCTGDKIPTATVAVKSMTPKLRKQILRRDQCCQYRDSSTGRLCGSTWQLQVDHRQARWAQGSNEEANLRLFCRQHNVFAYKRAAGISVS